MVLRANRTISQAIDRATPGILTRGRAVILRKINFRRDIPPTGGGGCARITKAGNSLGHWRVPGKAEFTAPTSLGSTATQGQNQVLPTKKMLRGLTEVIMVPSVNFGNFSDLIRQFTDKLSCRRRDSGDPWDDLDLRVLPIHAGLAQKSKQKNVDCSWSDSAIETVEPNTVADPRPHRGWNSRMADSPVASA